MVIPFRGAEWYWQVLYYVVTVILAVLLLVIVFFLFTRLASTLASPFNDLISERAEALATGWSDQTPLSLVTLLRDAGRSLVHSFKILGVYMVLLFVGLPFLLIPWIGGPLFTVFGALVSSYMHAYEYLGYPMDRRRFSFAEKRSFIRSHMRSAMGFGLGNLAVASIPLLNVLFVPAAVVGGTLLFLELSAFTGGPGTRNKRRPEQIETGLDSPRDGFEQTYPAD
jgi:CysZ protein